MRNKFISFSICALSSFSPFFAVSQSVPFTWSVNQHSTFQIQRTARNRVANEIITNIIHQYSIINLIKPYELCVELINIKNDIFEVTLLQNTIDKKTFKPITYFIKFDYSAKTKISSILGKRLP